MDKQDIRENIALAIQKLELFSDTLIKKKLSPLQETIHLARSFMNRNEKTKSDVQEAIEIIQKNFLFIQKLKKGNPAEKALAEASIKAVLRYNETVRKSSKKENRINQRISQFMYKKWGFSTELEAEKKLIYLPFEASAEFTYCQNPKEAHQISHALIASIQGHEHVLQEEADAFRMKIISLLKAEGFTPMGEEVRQSPIVATLHSEDLKKILISQVVKPFPGEIFAFKGTFQRNCEAFLKSVPLFGSFEILTNSKQTGFPHPIQHTGWALTDCMIPLYPSKPELLKEFIPFFKLKHKIALELLPKGSLIAKAKEILKLKKQVFEENKVFFFKKHQMLYETLFGEEIKTKIEPFFNHLKTLPSCYSKFTEIQEMIVQQFIITPFEKLKETYLEEKDKSLRYDTALSILEKEQENARKGLESQNDHRSIFMGCIGPLMAKRVNAILLQHFSETVGYSCLPLNSDEKKIQAALYKQLIAFQKELNEKFSKESILSNFIHEMNSDIGLFSSSFEECPDNLKKIVQELETYYS